jgi:putative spermidine/putrescine transport system permease protein
MLRLSATTKAILFAIVGFILLFMYTPLFVLILNSFNESQISGWPIESFSTKWWDFAKDYQPIRSALLNSLLVATGAMIIASILGTLVAFAIKGFDFFGKGTVNILVVLPIALPGVVTGVAFSNTSCWIQYRLLRNDRRSRDFLYRHGFQ